MSSLYQSFKNNDIQSLTVKEMSELPWGSIDKIARRSCDSGIYPKDRFYEMVSSYVENYDRGGISTNLIMEELQTHVDEQANTSVVLVSEDDSYKYLIKFEIDATGNDINLQSVCLVFQK